LNLKVHIKMEKEDIFFVEISNPEDVKRNILESLKDIVESLQRFEKFKETRKDKIDKINKLRKTVKEINKLVPSLKQAFPEAKIRAIRAVSKQPIMKVVKGKKKVSIQETKKPPTELQKLEDELSQIENKLQGLR